ncbi:protein kinase domain-containing protein [Bacillus thuringiensis]|uniref:class III lanthionine synthetase LanKC N-terminal domain-containing protein n=1 Tax=Bacillus thuringiensis TaxID=1428 RepID=UPI003DA01804
MGIEKFIKKNEDKWEEFCKRFLPIDNENMIWRYSRSSQPDDPEQGWKIHISATILSALEIFERVAPFLSDLKVLFKAPRSLHELKKLNCGLFYGYSQIGKFITVYPQTSEDAVYIAHQLHQLTYKLPCPSVPHDMRLNQDSTIHYRYGAFTSSLHIADENGSLVSAIRTPKGEITADLREPNSAVPNWITDPFIESSKFQFKNSSTPLTSVLTYEAISQRGKGGVYLALNLNAVPACRVILKEGRKDGETDWDGRDGFWRIQHETNVLRNLSSKGVEVPKVYDSFQVNKNYYLTMEFIDGQNLQSIILNKKISIKQALLYGLQTAKLLDKIHKAGWVWRDCKPMNLILNNDGTLRPIDFEGACSINQLEEMPWGTNGYIPPDWMDMSFARSRLSEDLYALGAILHQLLSGKVPSTIPLSPIGRLRKHVPPIIRRTISSLIDENPGTRPNADCVASILEEVLTVDFGIDSMELADSV